ncbi:MHC class I polypeptide-related sequence B-like isoform X6 [Equus przewalskii]|uniref:MHC class I polypeptide-related sequence B-like isoform X6 n=1 Tax=Equus przewalskii TaxID=9798 RepID=A0ABM4LMU7_EQUPR
MIGPCDMTMFSGREPAELGRAELKSFSGTFLPQLSLRLVDRPEVDKFPAMWLCSVLPFLASIALFAPVDVATGSPSLLYNLTVVSHHGSVQPRFFADGYLDGQPFLHYDSEKGRAEPRGLWAGAVLGAETWNTETKDLEKKVKDLKMTLADIMALQDQKGDSHSLQEIRGCEIQEDNSARGLWHFCYDGELFLSYNPKTNEWTVAKSSAQTQAVEIKKSWEADGFQSKDYHARVQGELCGRLRRYQKSWMGFMDHTVPPSVNVTCSQASDGMVTLTCWAFGFSPRNISVTWLQDEEPLSQDAQQSRGVLPDGNGTYQTWVAIRIPQGEEQRFMCHVEHSGNHTVHPVTSGKAVVQQFEWPVILALALGGSSSVFIAVTVCVLCYKKKKKTTPAAESTELVSLQSQHQMAPTDLNGTEPLGCQVSAVSP